MAALIGSGEFSVALDDTEETVTVESPPEGSKRTVTRYKFVNKGGQTLTPRTRVKDTSTDALARAVDYVDLYGLVPIENNGVRDDTGPVRVLRHKQQIVEELDVTPATAAFTYASWIDEVDEMFVGAELAAAADELAAVDTSGDPL